MRPTADGPAGDAVEATDHVESIREALDARARGAWAVVAVHDADDGVDPIAFSRLLFETADRIAAQGPSFLADAYEQVRSRAESLRAAQSCALVRGADEFELADARDVPPPTQEDDDEEEDEA